jgi:hypothetical protein
LRLLASADLIQPSLLAELLTEAEELKRIIAAIIVSAKREGAK